MIMNECPFCNIDENKKVLLNYKCFAIYDEYPVSPGHMLVIPSEHVTDYRNLTEHQRVILWDMVDKAIKFLTEKYHPDGFNIGINCGDAAGQSVPHVHIHVIPRYNGDVDNPKGGVGGVIPNKQSY